MCDFWLLDATGKVIIAQLMKLPKNLLAKAATVKNTGQVLEQLPQVISSLDAYMDGGLKSAPHLNTVGQLLSNMESSQLRSAFGGNKLTEELSSKYQEERTETRVKD